MSQQLRPSLSMPDDVWYLVAQYLRPEELRRLYGVNKALFHLSMEERYRNICFSNNDRRMKWLCKNIQYALVSILSAILVDSEVLERRWCDSMYEGSTSGRGRSNAGLLRSSPRVFLGPSGRR